MRALTSGDFYKRLRQAGIAGQVRASQVLEAFRLYMASEFPQVESSSIEPLFVRQKQLVVRSTNAALMNAVKDREEDIVQYLTQTTGVKIEEIRFRA